MEDTYALSLLVVVNAIYQVKVLVAVIVNVFPFAILICMFFSDPADPTSDVRVIVVLSVTVNTPLE